MRKIKDVLTSKSFWVLIFFVLIIFLSISFWAYGSLISFNDNFIFYKAWLRLLVLVVFWGCIFLFIFYPYIKRTIVSFKSSDKEIKKDIQSEIKDSIKKLKRNFKLAIKGAGKSWGSNVSIRKLPLFICIGYERSGKSSLISYSKMRYPVLDNLHNHKKGHLRTSNFNMWISENGILIDTQGDLFNVEDYFKADKTDDIDTDNIQLNKEYLVNKGKWNGFLKYLTNRRFSKKINGVILNIDIHDLLRSPTSKVDDIVACLSRRVNELQLILNTSFPVYVVFNKLDLVYGMREFFSSYHEIFKDKALGVTVPSNLDKKKLKNYVGFELFRMYRHMYSSLVKNRVFLKTNDNKKSAYFFIRSFSGMSNIISDLISKINESKSFDKGVFVRGLYFTSAYQESVPSNIMLDSAAKVYGVKSSISRAQSGEKSSYFIKSLFENIVFSDKKLSYMSGHYDSLRNIFTIPLFLLASGIAYFCLSNVDKNYESELARVYQTSGNVTEIVKNVTSGFEGKSNSQKAVSIARMDEIFIEYPELYGSNIFDEVVFLNKSYKSFTGLETLYVKLLDNYMQTTIVDTLKRMLRRNDISPNSQLKNLYIYKMLTDSSKYDFRIVRRWVRENWSSFPDYGVTQDRFLGYIDYLSKHQNVILSEDVDLVSEAQLLVSSYPRYARIYSLLTYEVNDKTISDYFNIRESIGILFDEAFDLGAGIVNGIPFYEVNNFYTRNGMTRFLNSVSDDMKRIVNIESWILGDDSLKSGTSGIKAIQASVIKLYLHDYEKEWQRVIRGVRPKQFIKAEQGLVTLSTLAKDNNPMLSLLRVVDDNTRLNNGDVLRQVAELGLPIADLRSAFELVTNTFEPYTKFLQVDNIIDVGLSKIVNTIDTKQAVRDKVPLPVSNYFVITEAVNEVYKKVSEQRSNMLLTGDSLFYALGINTLDEKDPFVQLKLLTNTLPIDLRRFYNELAVQSWNLILDRLPQTIEIAWKSELLKNYSIKVSSYYPFNSQALQDLSIDDFRSFFAKNGIWDTFYNKYLSVILDKRGRSFTVKNKYASFITFSPRFFETIILFNDIKDKFFDDNGNVILKFSLKPEALSGKFYDIVLSDNEKKLRYEHAFKNSLLVNLSKFDNDAMFKVDATYAKTKGTVNYEWIGFWSWYRFISVSSLKRSNLDEAVYSFGLDSSKSYFEYSMMGADKAVRNFITNALGFSLPMSPISAREVLNVK